MPYPFPRANLQYKDRLEIVLCEVVHSFNTMQDQRLLQRKKRALEHKLYLSNPVADLAEISRISISSDNLEVVSALRVNSYSYPN